MMVVDQLGPYSIWPTHVAVTHRRYLVENADMNLQETATGENTVYSQKIAWRMTFMLAG